MMSERPRSPSGHNEFYPLAFVSKSHILPRHSHRNIVATVNLGCRLDLKTIALHARNAEYNPKVIILGPFKRLDCDFIIA